MVVCLEVIDIADLQLFPMHIIVCVPDRFDVGYRDLRKQISDR